MESCSGSRFFRLQPRRVQRTVKPPPVLPPSSAGMGQPRAAAHRERKPAGQSGDGSLLRGGQGLGGSTSQDKEGKPGSSAEALDRSGPAAAGAVSSSLTTEGLWGQERGCRVEVKPDVQGLGRGRALDSSSSAVEDPHGLPRDWTDCGSSRQLKVLLLLLASLTTVRMRWELLGAGASPRNRASPRTTTEPFLGRR